MRDTDLFTLRGAHTAAPEAASDDGEVSDARVLTGLSVQFKMTDAQSEDLERLLREQQSRNSPQFHKFLTPEEFGSRFGPNSSDVAQVTGWLEGEGFSNVRLARSRTFVTFDGQAQTARQAFHTAIHRYRWKGATHFANSADPQLPAALRPVVANVRGLSDFGLEPRGAAAAVETRLTTTSGSNFLTPGDFATIYNLKPLYDAGFDGAGVRIAVVGQSNIQLSDIRAFRAAAGLPPADPEIVVAGTDPGVRQDGNQMEADLDIEWAGGVAPKATVVFVVATNALQALFYAVDNNLAPIISTSFGTCEGNVTRTNSDSMAETFKQANAQGITVIAASGDAGAAGCDTSNYPARRGPSVDFPASLPYVTGIGGTTLTEGSGTYWGPPFLGPTALSYIPEVAWNDPPTSKIHASGGGASTLNAKPTWQAGPGVVADGTRDVPDLALAASPSRNGYVYCTNGGCTNGFLSATSTLSIVGGTSAGSPAFAGILALVVQKLGPQGNINPDLYVLAQSAPEAFHDVVSGNNIVSCTAGSTGCGSGSFGYSTTAGYDQVTGLGSVDAARLADRWTTLSASASTTTAGPLLFVPVTPCRVADTRYEPAAFGGPKLTAGATREFDIPASACNIPANASAYALNVTVVPDGVLQYLTVWPSGQVKPFVSTLNSDGRIKANAAILAAGRDGGVNVYATESTHVVLDINGYFVSASSSSALQFFSLPPCRVVDTREARGGLGSPYVPAGQIRDFPVLSSSCGIPAAAQAYSLNITAVPRTPLLYVTAWPSGKTRPLASILNAPTASTTANAVIIPAGQNGAISTYASGDTELVIDVNGYFAPAGAGGTNLYTIPPCRIIDTRQGGAIPNQTLPVSLSTGCYPAGVKQGFVLNATVVPSGTLAYLTLWPARETQPVVSTLNADADTVTSNLAIVPTTTDSVNTFASNPTYLILDLFGYFAP